MSPYAQGTSVPVSRSRAELEDVLRRYGADGFAYMEDAGFVQIGFRIENRAVRIALPPPCEETLPERARTRTAAQTEAALAQEERRRWRALVLVVKAKLEAVESAISTLEREFLADLVLDGGQTVAEAMGPELARRLPEGRPLLLLPGGGS